MRPDLSVGSFEMKLNIISRLSVLMQELNSVFLLDLENSCIICSHN